MELKKMLLYHIFEEDYHLHWFETFTVESLALKRLKELNSSEEYYYSTFIVRPEESVEE